VNFLNGSNLNIREIMKHIACHDFLTIYTALI